MTVSINTIYPGDGKTFPKPGDEVSIHYVGTLETGKKFDSSMERGAPFKTKIGVGEVIEGWDWAVIRMSKGQKAVLKITKDLAYGNEGFPGKIPPNANLIVSINKSEQVITVKPQKYYLGKKKSFVGILF